MKKYKLIYTEIIGDNERISEQMLGTDNINWSIDRFSSSSSIIKMNIKSVKERYETKPHTNN